MVGFHNEQQRRAAFANMRAASRLPETQRAEDVARRHRMLTPGREPADLDPVASSELQATVFEEKTARKMRGRVRSHIRNQVRKGSYDHGRGVDLWRPVVDEAARLYCLRRACEKDTFPDEVRDRAAWELANDELERILQEEQEA